MSGRLRYPEFAPEGIATMRATEHYLNAASALPAVLLELVRLRVSLQNGCNFCVGHHRGELHKHNEPDSRIDALADWVHSDAFTPRERAALAWADSVTDIQTKHASEADYAAVSTFFHEKDLVDLTLAVASINAWNRMSIAFRAEWDPRRAEKKSTHESAEKGRDTPSAAKDRGREVPKFESPVTTAQSPSQIAPAHEDAPTRDAIDDDGGKVAQD